MRSVCFRGSVLLWSFDGVSCVYRASLFIYTRRGGVQLLLLCISLSPLCNLCHAIVISVINSVEYIGMIFQPVFLLLLLKLYGSLI